MCIEYHKNLQVMIQDKYLQKNELVFPQKLVCPQKTFTANHVSTSNFGTLAVQAYVPQVFLINGK